jgi:hypothetical protein
MSTHRGISQYEQLLLATKKIEQAGKLSHTYKPDVIKTRPFFKCANAAFRNVLGQKDAKEIVASEEFGKLFHTACFQLSNAPTHNYWLTELFGDDSYAKLIENMSACCKQMPEFERKEFTKMLIGTIAHNWHDLSVPDRERMGSTFRGVLEKMAGDGEYFSHPFFRSVVRQVMADGQLDTKILGYFAKSKELVESGVLPKEHSDEVHYLRFGTQKAGKLLEALKKHYGETRFADEKKIRQRDTLLKVLKYVSKDPSVHPDELKRLLEVKESDMGDYPKSRQILEPLEKVMPFVERFDRHPDAASAAKLLDWLHGEGMINGRQRQVIASGIRSKEYGLIRPILQHSLIEKIDTDRGIFEKYGPLKADLHLNTYNKESHLSTITSRLGGMQEAMQETRAAGRGPTWRR